MGKPSRPTTFRPILSWVSSRYNSRPPPPLNQASIVVALPPNTGPVPNREAALFFPYQYTDTEWAASSTPSLTASMTWNALTTAPAGRRSIFRRPPDMRSTRSTYSRAKSIQMSDAGQEVCILMTRGAGLAITAGAAMAPAAAAKPVFRNLRRPVPAAAGSVDTSASCLFSLINFPPDW